MGRSCFRTSFSVTTLALKSMGPTEARAMESCIGDVEELLGSSVFRRVLRRLIVPPGAPTARTSLAPRHIIYPRRLQTINAQPTARDRYTKASSSWQHDRRYRCKFILRITTVQLNTTGFFGEDHQCARLVLCCLITITEPEAYHDLRATQASEPYSNNTISIDECLAGGTILQASSL